ncbi:hypothetical protein EW146_g9491 [Bondarzewia mesenterica]|uniref:Rho-GAP domain-containing protein n=1 Tax=Bondarzewia mesenterica TaxID=1095465 RepID=A0A4S4L797_9AGAM|nr:hypothetical protein EW146_g9491 [Bondarzewia mesenterica]
MECSKFTDCLQCPVRTRQQPERQVHNISSPDVDSKRCKGKATEEPELPTISSPPPLSPPLPPAKLSIPSTIVAHASSFTPAHATCQSVASPAVSDLLSHAASELPLHPARSSRRGSCITCRDLEVSLDRAEDAGKDLTEREGLLRRIGEFGNMFEASDDAFDQFRPVPRHSSSARLWSSPQQMIPIADNFMKRSNTFFKRRHQGSEHERTGGAAARVRAHGGGGGGQDVPDRKVGGGPPARGQDSVAAVPGTLSNLPKALEPSLHHSTMLITAFLPEADLNTLIERHRTGPFHPNPQLYESVTHDESDVLFGIDSRKWAEGGWIVLRNGEEKKELVPPALTVLLEGLGQAYEKLPTDNVGSSNKVEKDPASEQQHLEALQNVLQRWPKIHLHVLDAIVGHLKTLINNTKTGESDEVYITKLALSIGRTIIHPKFKTEISIQDRHPAGECVTLSSLSQNTVHRAICVAFFVDLVKCYEEIIPPTIVKKKRESERKVPIRKRTAPIDLLMSRSRLSVGTDAREWLANQRANGSVLPPVPPTAVLVTEPQPEHVAEPVPSPIAEVVEPIPSPTAEAPVTPAIEPPALPAAAQLKDVSSHL